MSECECERRSYTERMDEPSFHDFLNNMAGMFREHLRANDIEFSSIVVRNTCVVIRFPEVEW